MTMWIGSLGGMVPTPCASDLRVEGEDRVVYGGGAGTLAPARALVLAGPGARTWDVQVTPGQFESAAALSSLVRRQHRVGGGLRVIPCGAEHTNMFDPGASEEFAGWSGALTVAGGGVGVEPETLQRRVFGPTVLEPDTVLTPETVLSVGSWMTREQVVEHTVYPATTVTVPAGAGVTSPVVPLVGPAPWRGHAAVFLRTTTAPVAVTLQAVDATGNVVAQHSPAPVGSPGGLSQALRRHAWSWDLSSPTAVGLRLRLSATEPFTAAWPSLALGDDLHRFVTGRGCEQAVLSGVPQDVLLAVPLRELASWSYRVREVGV